MATLSRTGKGERWRLVGDGKVLGPGDKVELKIGRHWVLTEIEWSHTTNDYRCKTMGAYMYNGQQARSAEVNQ